MTLRQLGENGASLEEGDLLPMYGGGGGRPSSSGSSSSAGTPSPMLAAPQPLKAANGAATATTAPHGHPTQPRKYQCKMCPQVFAHKSAMQQHSREAHRGDLKPHQCTQCLKSFSSTHQLAQHVRIHTGEKPYKCSYCERRFKQLSHVQQHTRLHTGERPYKCHVAECGRAFIQLSNLQQHLRNHDSQMERAKSRPFHCNICGKGFASDSSLRTHRSKQHAALIGGAASQSCPICHKICVNAEALMEHMRISHKDPPVTAPGTGTHGLVETLQVALSLQKTKASSSNNSNNNNSNNNSNSSSSKQQQQHQRRIGQPQLTHACPVCGKAYVNEGSLRKHVSTHPEAASLGSPLRMWPCTVCHSVFTHETGLLHHMEHMRMDPKHQFAAQYLLSRAAAERREKHGGPSAGPPHDMLSAVQPQPQTAALAAVMQPPPSSLAALQASHLAHS
ncbi:LOW QUALITY PROTEIN: zinc finger protein 879 [Dermacentor silvarum]|uniref:LOW QUALITY PROTEIN: zinc finger protein 879 n=1 Tax=Dermacentor silvarum TaxID=543639 RepID=UPI002100DBFF|nr:LOW QUALITY PROTEIN: zinc finger protein 879 [Dermacentor silvarum]